MEQHTLIGAGNSQKLILKAKFHAILAIASRFKLKFQAILGLGIIIFVSACIFCSFFSIIYFNNQQNIKENFSCYINATFADVIYHIEI